MGRPQGTQQNRRLYRISWCNKMYKEGHSWETLKKLSEEENNNKISHVRLLATPWTGAYQAPPSMGFSRQEYWSGVPLPSPSWP